MNHDILPEVLHKMVKDAHQRKVMYAVVDRYNRYLVDWIGWAGFWGPIKDMRLFKTRRQAKEQIAFMFIDYELDARIVKVVQDKKEYIEELGPLQLTYKQKQDLAQKRYVK